MVLLLLAMALLSSHSISINSQNVSTKSIFILAGQSNMAGRGGVLKNRWDAIVPPECVPNERILRLSAALIWEEAHEPLHRDIDVERACGIGPGMAFANAILERGLGIGVIGLVPCAVGGTNLTEWARGGWLYNQMVIRARAALQGGGGIIRAILWYQGESDTRNLNDARQYKNKLETFFQDVRSDFMSPLLPVIQVALASGQGPYVEEVREAQLSINLPNVITVDAKGLPLNPAGLHLSTAGEVRLGGMMANAFVEVPLAPLPIPSTAATAIAVNFLLVLLLSSPYML